MRNKLALLILLMILGLPRWMNAQIVVKLKSQAERAVECKSSDVSFRCSRGLKIVLDGITINGIFLAKQAGESYSVFVLAPKETLDKQNLITESVKTLLKTLYPKESQDYRWTDIEFINNKPSSKFEVDKKLRLGFNGNHLITFGYRQLVIENKSMFIGSIGSDEAKGEEAEELFGRISGKSTADVLMK